MGIVKIHILLKCMVLCVMHYEPVLYSKQIRKTKNT